MTKGSDFSLPTRFLLSIVLLFLLTFLAYANTFNSPFNFDDTAVLRGDIESHGTSFYQLYPLKYRHLFFLSLKLNHEWGRYDPFGYHLVNFFLHFASSILVLLIAFHTIDRGTGLGRKAAVAIGGITSILFAMNPVHSEAVTYISGRASSMSAFFCLSSLLLFILGSRKETTLRFFRSIFYLLSLGSFFLALLAKETTFVFPAALLLYDLCFMGNDRWYPRKERWLYIYLPFPLMGGIFLFLSDSIASLILLWLKKIDLSYALTQGKVLTYAFKMLVFPINLTFDYDFPPEFFPQGNVRFLPLLLIGGLVLVVIKNFQKVSTVLAFSILWYLIILSPTNSFLPRPDLLSERNLYLPSFGLILLLAVTLYFLFFLRYETIWKYRLGLVCLSAILLANAALLIHRNSNYQSNILLWEDTLQKSPGKLRALHNLSHFYLSEKNYPKAFAALKKLAASNASPFYRSLAHSNLGSLYIQLGNPEEAEKEFHKAIQADPTIPAAYINLGSLFASRNQFNEAREVFQKAEDRYKKFRWGYSKPAELNLNKAKVNLKLGLYEEAEQDIKNFLQADQDSDEVHLLLGQIFAATGRDELAIREYKKSTANPTMRAKAHNNTGILYIRQSRYQEALREFDQALSYNPNLPDALFNAGKLLVETKGDPQKANDFLQAALSQSRDPARSQQIRNLLHKLNP